VERVFAEEASAQPQFAEPVVDGDRVVVEWRSRVQLRDGSEENLVGVSLLRFDDSGLVEEQRDIWCQGRSAFVSLREALLQLGLRANVDL
jgi:hypothetical protein